MGLLIKGAYSANAAMDDNVPLHRISMCVLTGPLVANANAGRDTFRRHDSQRRIDLAGLFAGWIGIAIIRFRLIAYSNRN